MPDWICRGSEDKPHEELHLSELLGECPHCDRRRPETFQDVTEATNTTDSSFSSSAEVSGDSQENAVQGRLEKIIALLTAFFAIPLFMPEPVRQVFGWLIAVLILIPWKKVKSLFEWLWAIISRFRIKTIYFLIFLSVALLIIIIRAGIFEFFVNHNPLSPTVDLNVDQLVKSFYAGQELDSFYTLISQDKSDGAELETQVLYHDIRQKNFFQNCTEADDVELTKFWSLAASQDGKYWASGVARKKSEGNAEENWGVIWDQKGNIFAQAEIDDQTTIDNLSFLNQSCLITGHHNGTIGVWDFENETDKITAYPFSDRGITHISVNKNSQILVTDKTKNVKSVLINQCSLDLETSGITLNFLDKFKDKILVAEYLSSDPEWIVTVLTDGILNLSNLTNGKSVNAPINPEFSNLRNAWISLSQDSQYVLVGYDSNDSYFLQFFKITFNDSLPEIESVNLQGRQDNNLPLEYEIRDLDLTRQSDRLIAIVGGKNGLLKRITISIDQANISDDQQYAYNENYINSPYKDQIISGLLFNPNPNDQSEFISVTESRNPPILWDLNGSREDYYTEENVSSNVTKILTRDANTITFVVLLEDGVIKRYDSTLNSRGELRGPSLFSHNFVDLELSNDRQNSVVTLNEDNQLQFWDPDRNNLRKSLNLQKIRFINIPSEIKDLVFCPNDVNILVVSSDDQIQAIDLAQEALIEDLSPQSVRGIKDLKFSSTGRYLGAIVQRNSSDRQELEIWNFDPDNSSQVFGSKIDDQYFTFDFDPTDDSSIIVLTKNNEIQLLSLIDDRTIEYQSTLLIPDLQNLKKDDLNQVKWNKILFSDDEQYLILAGEGIITLIDWTQTKENENMPEIQATVSSIFEGDWSEIIDIKTYSYQSEENFDQILLFSDANNHLIRLELLPYNSLMNNGRDWTNDYEENKMNICFLQ